MAARVPTGPSARRHQAHGGRGAIPPAARVFGRSSSRIAEDRSPSPDRRGMRSDSRRGIDEEVRFMNVLIDVNVALDVLLEREPWLADSQAVWDASHQGRITGDLIATGL